MKTVSLDYIIKNVMASMEQSDMARYQTYLQYAIRGFRKLNLHTTTTTKTAYLNMTSGKAINLPTDYIKYTAIGMVVSGRIVTLGLDNRLALNGSVDECGEPLGVVVDNVEAGLNTLSPTYEFPGIYQGGKYSGPIYGLGGGFSSRGYYKFNAERNQIQFTSDVPTTQIVMEYISDGLNPDGTAALPIAATETLIAFVHWKRKEHASKGKFTETEILRAKREFQQELGDLRHIEFMFTPEEFLDMLRGNIHQTPKR